MISSGTNGGYNAAPGYNLVTGLGTPVANLLVPDLVAGNYPATGRVAPISSDLNANPGWSGSGGGEFNAMHVFSVSDEWRVTSDKRDQGLEIKNQESRIRAHGLSEGGNLVALRSGLVRTGTELAAPAAAAGAEDGLLKSRAWDGAAGAVESASDLVFAGYDLGGVGQDSGTEPWVGVAERSGDAFDVYGEEFQTVLEEWQGS